jgi:hypothetical protein
MALKKRVDGRMIVHAFFIWSELARQMSHLLNSSHTVAYSGLIVPTSLLNRAADAGAKGSC